MKKYLFLVPFFATSVAFASGGEINGKTFSLCESQDDFMRFAAIASTGHNIALGHDGVPVYRQKGRYILLKDSEIDYLLDKLSKDHLMRALALVKADSYSKRIEIIKCSQLPADSLITYDRLKEAGKL